VKRRGVRGADPARFAYPPPELLAFDPDDWPDDGPVPHDKFRDWPPRSPAVGAALPPDLARRMRAWSRWTVARQAWEDAHGDRWPTGAVQRWVEQREARPGSRTRLAPWDRYDEDGGGWS
jgi:hypothetical protein